MIAEAASVCMYVHPLVVASVVMKDVECQVPPPSPPLPTPISIPTELS